MMTVAHGWVRYHAVKDVHDLLNRTAANTDRQRLEASLVYDTEGFRRYVVERIHSELGVSTATINTEIDKWVWKTE